jgi:hypothetical protein
VRCKCLIKRNHSFYGGPLRGIFHNLRKRGILHSVQTLVLDGLNVPADLITEIITHQSFNVRILSIRDVQQLNFRKLQQALLYIVRPGRAENTPKLQGMYFFGPRDIPTRPQAILPAAHDFSSGDMVLSQGAQIGARWNMRSEDTLAEEIARKSDRWYEKTGAVFPRSIGRESEWAEVIQACQGIISFDAIACPGPRHASGSVPRKTWYSDIEFHISPRIATHALDGCAGCGAAPEGPAKTRYSSTGRLPLMAPLPMHSSTIKCARIPSHTGHGLEKKLIIRCMDCLRQRYCENCHIWWCEDCYKVNPGPNLAEQWAALELESAREKNLKVLMGLCVACRVMKAGADTDGMWG